MKALKFPFPIQPNMQRFIFIANQIKVCKVKQCNHCS